MNQLLPTSSHQEKMQKSKEEHSFSDELNGNWIKNLRSEQNQERKGNAKKTAPGGCQKAKGQNYNRK